MSQIHYFFNFGNSSSKFIVYFHFFHFIIKFIHLFAYYYFIKIKLNYHYYLEQYFFKYFVK
jgi:hypothetical protein